MWEQSVVHWLSNFDFCYKIRLKLTVSHNFSCPSLSFHNVLSSRKKIPLVNIGTSCSIDGQMSKSLNKFNNSVSSRVREKTSSSHVTSRQKHSAPSKSSPSCPLDMSERYIKQWRSSNSADLGWEKRETTQVRLFQRPAPRIMSANLPDSS